MLNEYRYQGVSVNGKGVQGIVIARNKSNAKKIIKTLAEKHKLKINSILTKKVFLYYVKMPNGKRIKGRQSAYTKGEVARALAAIGYKNAKIEPTIIDIKLKPPFASILMFVNLS